MKIFGKNFDDKKVKKIVYTAVLVLLAFWFVYRFVMVAIESRMVVFNPVRDANKNGILVQTVVAEKQEGFIKFPIAIKSNRAYISGAGRAKLRAGQKITEGGTIAHVSNSLDLDSAMYVVQTRGAADGVNNVEISCNGYFIPVYAVPDDVVMIVRAGKAEKTSVKVVAQDSSVACVTSGIDDGDTVILSKVDAGQKVSVER